MFEGSACAACDDDPCAVEGLACIVENEACEETGGTVTTGTICGGDVPEAVWDVADCE